MKDDREIQAPPLSTYHYENANPERFQELCQALLLPEYPGLQCFPVGQPDGGRDAVSQWSEDGSKAVIQVKFKRASESPVDLVDWVITALEGEKAKILKLAEAGMEQYVLVTNANGSAHPSVGRIDKVQEWLDSNLPVRAQTLWRADLDRRMDGALALKWKYPEVLTGTDGIRLALESQWSEGGQRRSRAIKSFLTYQFDRDSEVKFKQMDLRNDLLSLFIDIHADLSERMRTSIPRRNLETYREVVLNHRERLDIGARRVPTRDSKI